MTPGCSRPAVTADHVVSAWELARAGRLDVFFDPSNLRAACRSCNSRRGTIERNARYRGVPRRRRVVDLTAAAESRAEAENRYWAELEADRRAEAVEALLMRVKPRPAIY